MSPVPVALSGSSRRSLGQTYLTQASTVHKPTPNQFHHLETRRLRRERRSNTRTCSTTRRIMIPRGPKSQMEAYRDMQAEALWIIYVKRGPGALIPDYWCGEEEEVEVDSTHGHKSRAINGIISLGSMCSLVKPSIHFDHYVVTNMQKRGTEEGYLGESDVSSNVEGLCLW
jgi:hypothetical protein